MKANSVQKNFIICLLLTLSVQFSSAVNPEGPVALWNGYNVRSGEDVQLYAFVPEHPSGISVIVCPGGSYHWLDEEGEGLEVGDWLCRQGITAFVLFYRTAGAAEFAWHTRILLRGRRYPDMIADAQRALHYVRENADRYGIDRERIGMMGFSAGGHLVMSAACFHHTDFLEEIYGQPAGTDLKPAFVAAIYPVVTMNRPYVHRRSRRGLLGDSRTHSRTMRDSLSIENHIPEDCPPVFLINCADDPVVPYQNSVLLDSALTAKHIPHKYIQYAEGKHGFGVSDYFGSDESREWKNEFLTWLSLTIH